MLADAGATGDPRLMPSRAANNKMPWITPKLLVASMDSPVERFLPIALWVGCPCPRLQRRGVGNRVLTRAATGCSGNRGWLERDGVSLSHERDADDSPETPEARCRTLTLARCALCAGLVVTPPVHDGSTAV